MHTELAWLKAIAPDLMGVVTKRYQVLQFINWMAPVGRRTLAEQMKISALQKLIDACGPEGFIQVENEILRELNASKSIIATGGSAVYSDEAMKHLAEIGTIVYLKITYDQLVSRLSDLQERGVVLKGGIGMSLRELYDERLPLYEQYAEVTVDVNDLSITAAARKVADALKQA